MNIRRRFQLKALASLLLLLLGVTTIVLVLAVSVPGSGETYQNGYFLGLGCGLTLGALILGIYSLYTLSSKERLRKVEIEKNDERNRTLRQLAALITMYVALFGLYALAIGLTFSGRREEGNLIMQVCIAGAAVYVVTYAILNKVR